MDQYLKYEDALEGRDGRRGGRTYQANVSFQCNINTHVDAIVAHIEGADHKPFLRHHAASCFDDDLFLLEFRLPKQRINH